MVIPYSVILLSIAWHLVPMVNGSFAHKLVQSGAKLCLDFPKQDTLLPLLFDEKSGKSVMGYNRIRFINKDATLTTTEHSFHSVVCNHLLKIIEFEYINCHG